MGPQRFPVRFTGASNAMRVLGLRPATSYVEVGSDSVEVRMGPAFVASIPRQRVASVHDDDRPVRGWGVHGWRGTWLLNGSARGVVRVEIAPQVEARVLGIPVALRVLRVAVDDPAGLLAALETPVEA